MTYEVAQTSEAVGQLVGKLAIAALVWWRASKRGWQGWFWALFFLIIPPLALCFYWLIAHRESRHLRESQERLITSVGGKL